MRRRKSLRLPSFDYARPGTTFVTICLSPRRPLLSKVEDGQVSLRPLGAIVADELARIPLRHPCVSLDTSVVMPDHVHALLVVRGGDDAIPAIVGGFKSRAARRVNELRSTPGAPFWQRGFFDHVVRDEADLERCRRYVVENPARWSAAGR